MDIFTGSPCVPGAPRSIPLNLSLTGLGEGGNVPILWTRTLRRKEVPACWWQGQDINQLTSSKRTLDQYS